MIKKLIILLFLASIVSITYGQPGKNPSSTESVSYYYKGQKLFFNVSYKKIIIGFAEGNSPNELKKMLAAIAKIPGDSIKETAVRNQLVVKLNEITSRETGKRVIEALKDNKIILYARPGITGMGGKISGYGNDFIVKLKPGIIPMQLNSLLNKHNCKIERTYTFDKNILIIGAGPLNNYDGLKMANIFFESGIFEYSEPDLAMFDARHTPPNDPLYSLQWNLKNTGTKKQYSGVRGADLNIDSAWGITMGSPSVKVAVIDEGVDGNHPDLKENLLQGFDCISLTSNIGDGSPRSGNNAHGTCCAGIIAAVANNGIGIAGIAPKCKIIPVNLANENGYYTTNSNIAAGIDYAWMHDADILSNSWGGGSPSSILDDAIYRAVTKGRDGKGCIVFFSAGNDNAGISYPAINENVIAVGGITMCDKRKDFKSCDGEYSWGASYGAGLDIVAPCVKIPTTDIAGPEGYSGNDYYEIFNGTSAACPNAAAVAALVLSVKPGFTQNEVRTILETTADKIPGYPFKTINGYKNGTWNSEMGYGRVDAYHAILAAQKDSFCNAEIAASGKIRFCSGDSVNLNVLNPKNNATYKWYNDSVIVSNNAKTISAKKTGNYYVIATYSNKCKATSAAIPVTAVKSTSVLIADAGQDVGLCAGSSGARIGGMPSASGGAAFLNEKRAYAMDWFTNNLYRFSLINPSDIDSIATNMVSKADLKDGNFFVGGDFTPYGYYAITRITNKLYRIDTANGTKRLVKTLTPSNGEWAGLAWDPEGQQLYGMSSFGQISQLYTIGFITGSLQFIGNIPAYNLAWIAFDNDGKLYGLSLASRHMYVINKSNASASALPGVVDEGFNYYAQDADVDPITNDLYLTAFTEQQGYVGDLRIANTNKGTLKMVGTIGAGPYNQMDATAITGYTYKYNWKPVSGLSNSKDANPFVSPVETTKYTLTVTDLCGQQATATVKVTVNASAPVAKISASKNTVCQGEKLRLSATEGTGYTYQWYLNNKKIEKATKSSYLATVAGSYTVNVSLGPGGCNRTSASFTVSNCSGKSSGFAASDASENKTGATQYKLYPNPATSIITVTLPQSANASVITVYDIAGSMVLRKELKGNAASEQLNISRLAAGSYRVIWQQDEQQYTWKFVKQ